MCTLCQEDMYFTHTEGTLIHVEENVVSMFVVSVVLVFTCNNDGCPPCFTILLQCHVQLEQITGILRRCVGGRRGAVGEWV